MKSKVNEVSNSDGFSSDIVWDRIFLDIDELADSVAADNLRDLVVSVLKESRYKDFSFFTALVGDVIRSVLICVAFKIRNGGGTGTGVGVFINRNQFDEMEHVSKKWQSVNNKTPITYWVGEKS